MRRFKYLFEDMMRRRVDGDPGRIGENLDEEFEKIRARLAELERKNKG